MTAPAEPHRDPFAELVAQLRMARALPREQGERVALDEVTSLILAERWAAALGQNLADVAPDVAADYVHLLAAVEAIRARRRLDLLGAP